MDADHFSPLNSEPQGAISRQPGGSNIVLVGASGAGKSQVGYLLAKLLGYGFIDLDRMIEGKARQTTEEVFQSHGEEHFRRLESTALGALRGLRSHVVATGGGAVMAEGNWELLARLGTTVWLNTPADEIARRLAGLDGELQKRPLLAEALAIKDPEARLKLLAGRISALIGNRLEHYRKADLVVTDTFSTAESSAQHVRSVLVKAGALSLPTEQQPYDRWHVL